MQEDIEDLGKWVYKIIEEQSIFAFRETESERKEQWDPKEEPQNAVNEAWELQEQAVEVEVDLRRVGDG